MNSPPSGIQIVLSRFLRALGLPNYARRFDHRIPRDAGDDETQHFILRIVQPGLAGLMDGSVSTLAPIFATAFVSHRPFYAFLVGMASATGAGISMAFSEALSDDGKLTGRGNPVVRGSITGIMTFIGGTLHTLPFLASDLHVALGIAYVVVVVELFAIAAIRKRFFGTRWATSIFQVVGGARWLSSPRSFLGMHETRVPPA